MKHKHCEVIKAWAEGRTVQMKTDSGRWISLVHPDIKFYQNCEYRVKPETVRFRVGLLKTMVTSQGHCTVLINEASGEDYMERIPGFKRWLGDWMEVEV